MSAPEYMQCVYEEKAQLVDRTEKLRGFLSTDTYHNMAKIDKQLLIAQLNVMESCRIVLEMRIQRFADTAVK